ncbi:hypothetical protein B0I72DRAFT_135691 [Yarrowia lipolytica]|uniref:Uncharacterized protein n=1 Tax=Yarrowia lipolytica TaxID=4952 RepID=A0A371CB12_YARLL|nr:hypothetical protein BKA91DRAFT_136168 [Yarrowia lipolytica]KAE8172729.1 hypothetical protein BKA90DRAFT_136806 [Yarrowia lipolytica]RDW27466.1 hypothetical protein B0I71DRAFT_129046 [Yarrowia lipolytica]RDW33825.1 hypothetical protein B0I72DRAFT_135691 [Yarrowia lipolytica]RDW39034.1 hypothetical protein B0I73DRAFT_132762 [Yarrowia lipolytica]
MHTGSSANIAPVDVWLGLWCVSVIHVAHPGVARRPTVAPTRWLPVAPTRHDQHQIGGGGTVSRRYDAITRSR